MLDPISAIGAAGIVLQFIDFATEIVTKGNQIYRSGDSIVKEYQDPCYLRPLAYEDEIVVRVSDSHRVNLTDALVLLIQGQTRSKCTVLHSQSQHLWYRKIYEIGEEIRLPQSQNVLFILAST